MYILHCTDQPVNPAYQDVLCISRYVVGSNNSKYYTLVSSTTILYVCIISSIIPCPKHVSSIHVVNGCYVCQYSHQASIKEDVIVQPLKSIIGVFASQFLWNENYRRIYVGMQYVHVCSQVCVYIRVSLHLTAAKKAHHQIPSFSVLRPQHISRSQTNLLIFL